MAGTLALTACAPELPMPPVLPPSETEEAEPEEHPLSWYIDQVWNEQERSAGAESIIAGCMAFNGFDYTPEVAVKKAERDMSDDEVLEAAEKNGYGVTDDYVAQLGENLHEVTGANAEYFEKLSAAKQKAYLDALDGTQENGFEGCRSEAQLFTMDHDPARIYQDDDFRDLVAALGALPETISTDARSVALNVEWAACMREERPIRSTERADVPEEMRENLQELGDPSEAELAEFRELEIAIATADATCAKSVGWSERIAEVRDEYETRFVEEHLDDLEAVVDRYGL